MSNVVIKTITLAALCQILSDNKVRLCVTADEYGIPQPFTPALVKPEFWEDEEVFTLKVGDDEGDEMERLEYFGYADNQTVTLIQYDSDDEGELCARFVSNTGIVQDVYFVAPVLAL